MKRLIYLIGLIGLTIIVGGVLPASAVVSNGSFETGDLTGWEGDSYSTSGGNGIYAANSLGSLPPACAGEVLPDLGNTDGAWVAILDQGGPTSNFLTQTMVIDGPTLSLDLTYWNDAGVWLWYGTFYSESQYLRVDLIQPAASNTTMNASDILLTIFETVEGTTPYSAVRQTLSVDVSSFMGQTVTLRIGQTVVVDCMPVAIDNVRLNSPVEATGGYGKIGQVHVAAPGSVIYESAGGGVVRDSGGDEIWVPNPTAHDPSQDTYDVISQTTLEGTVWVEIFLGNTAHYVWLPLSDYVTPIYLP